MSLFLFVLSFFIFCTTVLFSNSHWFFYFVSINFLLKNTFSFKYFLHLFIFFAFTHTTFLFEIPYNTVCCWLVFRFHNWNGQNTTSRYNQLICSMLNSHQNNVQLHVKHYLFRSLTGSLTLLLSYEGRQQTHSQLKATDTQPLISSFIEQTQTGGKCVWYFSTSFFDLEY